MSLVGGKLLVLIWLSLASELHGINLEDRFNKLEKEVQQQNDELKGCLQKLTKEKQRGDNELESRLRKLETEMRERDRKNQLLKNQIKSTIRSTMKDTSVEGNGTKVENATTESISEFDLFYQQFIEFFLQNDLFQRSSIETVAFYAYLRSSMSAKCFNDHEIIIYDVKVTDTSGSYNNYDGIFVAPVTGTYAFAITVVPNLYKWVSYEIVSEGQVIGGAIGDSEEQRSHNPGSITVVVRLESGAHVYVRRSDGSGSCASYSEMPFVTSFAGWLIGF